MCMIFLNCTIKQTIAACEVNFYSSKSAPLLLQNIKEQIEHSFPKAKVVFTEDNIKEIIKAITSKSTMIIVKDFQFKPQAGEQQLSIVIYSPTKLLREIQNKLNEIFIGFIFVPRKIKTEYVPNTLQSYQRTEIIFTNDLTIL